MASSNHVQLDHEPLQGQSNMFDHDLHGYNALFSNGQEQAFDPNDWNLDPNLSLNIPRNPSTSVPHSWHSTPVPQPASSQNPTLNLSNGLYGRSFSNSPAPYHDPLFNNHGNIQQYHQSSLDPSLVAASSTSNPGFDFGMPAYPISNAQSGTIAPEALQSGPSYLNNGYGSTSAYQGSRVGGTQTYGYSQPATKGSPGAGMGRSERFTAPKGEPSGNFIIVDSDSLAQATRSKRLHNFVNISDVAQEYPATKTTIPAYVPRKSRNELRKLAAGDSKLLAKVSKKQPKKAKLFTPKTIIQKPISTDIRPAGVKEESSASPSETESSDDESEYESSEEELEITEPSPLPPTRPQQAMEAVRYDTIKAVWLPRQRPAEAEQIRNGLKDFWEVVKTTRDRWKSDTEAVKKAEEAKNNSELPLLKERVQRQRDMIEVALQAAIEYGHPGIIRLFGENKPFLFLLYQFMADRVRENDLDGKLSKAALEVREILSAARSNGSTLNTESLEQPPLNKVLSRYMKKGNEAIKSLAKKIIESAASNASKSKSEPSKQEKIGEVKDKDTPSSIKTEPVRRPAPEQVAGVKRARPGDTSNAQPPKRVTSGSLASTSAALNAAKPTASGLKRPLSSATDKPTSTTGSAGAAATKPKGTQVAAKPSSFFSGLQSASKKPGTSNAALAAAAQQKSAATSTTTEKKQATLPAASMQAAKPTFSFAQTIANLTKPKEPEPSAKPEEKRPPETPEERAKRLRKEGRRKLRVSWKPDTSLVSIKVFHHDPEEELGHDESMVRDAGDVGGEGRMFKQHKDMMDMDEDDDIPRDELIHEYKTPSLIDFSSVPKEERERNYAPYGGGFKEPESPERAVRERYEASTLMIYYSDRSDIPPCPREPADAYTGEAITTVDFGAPPEITQARAAMFQPATSAQPAAPAIDVSALLSILNAPSQQQQPAQAAPVVPASQPTSQQPGSTALEDIFKQFAVPAQQPALQPPPAPVMQAPATNSTPDISSILASLQAHSAPQQAPAPPVPQPQPQVQPQYQPLMYPPVPPNPADLSAIIAQFGQANMPMPSLPMPGFPYPAQQNASGVYEDPERKRYREGDHDDRDGEGNAGSNKRKKWINKGKGTIGPDGKPKFVVECTFWKQGRCKKGADCTFLHGSPPRGN